MSWLVDLHSFPPRVIPPYQSPPPCVPGAAAGGGGWKAWGQKTRPRGHICSAARFCTDSELRMFSRISKEYFVMHGNDMKSTLPHHK